MTEAEWESSDDPGPMLALLESRPPPLGRKRKLLLCAAARHLLGGDPGAIAPALEAVEAWAASLGEEPRGSLSPRTAVYDVLFSLDADRQREQEAVRLLSLATVGEKGQWATAAREACKPAVLAGLLREVFRNPLRRVHRVGDGVRRRVRVWPMDRRPRDLLFVSDWAAWNDGLPIRLAQGIEQRRAWNEMPILGDALEEAGCDEPAILEHLRGAGTHARGCWVLDLVMGKE